MDRPIDGLPGIDPNFEPQNRPRSNTWPCRPRENDASSSPVSDESLPENQNKVDSLGLNKKSSSRRNAWGNLSYADLITKAIQGAPDQRLTLSQIYDWMVQNVPYFKDKGDSTSSAGWKNSIRHNLSLHSRFMRIQNEGTGKSSWWVINPDAKPGKTPRRRAGSMETKSYEKRRGRVKKKVDALRASMENNSPSSTTNDDYLNDSLGFQLSPEFRDRASSNASSCGRLSPIQAVIETDLHDNQVPPMSPIPWGSEVDSSSLPYPGSDGFTDQLVDTLVDGMKLGENQGLSMSGDAGDIDMMSGGLQQQLISSNNNINMSQFGDQNSDFDDPQYTNLAAPPSYSESQQKPRLTTLERMSLNNGGYSNMDLGMYINDMMTRQDPVLSQNSMMSPPQISPSSQLSVNTQQQQQQQQQQLCSSPAHSPQVSPSNYANFAHSPQNKQMVLQGQVSPQQQREQQRRSLLQQVLESPTESGPSPALLQRCLETPNESLLRAALTQKLPSYQQMVLGGTLGNIKQEYGRKEDFTCMKEDYGVTVKQEFPVKQEFDDFSACSGMSFRTGSTTQIRDQVMTAGGTVTVGKGAQTLQGGRPTGNHIGQLQTQPMQTNPSANSLDNIETDFMLDMDLNVEQMLQHELSLDPNLDFNFENVGSSSSTENQNMVR